MNDDDVVGKRVAEFGLPRNLEGMSVDSLKEYRKSLEAEIRNVEDALAHREGAVAGAEALFKI